MLLSGIDVPIHLLPDGNNGINAPPPFPVKEQVEQPPAVLAKDPSATSTEKEEEEPAGSDVTYNKYKVWCIYVHDVQVTYESAQWW